MQDISFQRVGANQRDRVIDFLVSDEWPFHGTSRPTRRQVRSWIRKGTLLEPHSRSFWIRKGMETVGLVTLKELDDPTPIIDIRIRTAFRGCGIGRIAIRWITDFLFRSMAKKIRLEGHVRADNLAMRKVFLKCGYAKEAYYRQAWPGKDGRSHDAVAYAITRHDWKTGRVTPPDLSDDSKLTGR